MVVKTIWIILVLHKSILKNMDKNIETHFVFIKIWMSLILILLFFLAKLNGSINNFIL